MNDWQQNPGGMPRDGYHPAAPVQVSPAAGGAPAPRQPVQQGQPVHPQAAQQQRQYQAAHRAQVQQQAPQQAGAQARPQPAPAAPEIRVQPTRHGANMDFLTGQRDVSAFLKAREHSGMVRRMRVVLPAIAIAMIVVIGGAWMLSGSGEPDPFLVGAQAEDGRMVMQNPELKGLDDQQRPYHVTASRAVQDAKQPDMIELSEITAEVPMDEKVNARIVAGNGLYNSKAKTLKLGGAVNVKTDNGMTMLLEDADVDIDAGTLATEKPVSVTSIQAKISANKLQVEDNGKRIILEDRVRMTIYPDKIKQDGAAAGSSTLKTADAN